MAERGKPISIPMRLEIKQLRTRDPVRKVAATLHLSKSTVQKYGKQFGTNSLQKGVSVD